MSDNNIAHNNKRFAAMLLAVVIMLTGCGSKADTGSSSEGTTSSATSAAVSSAIDTATTVPDEQPQESTLQNDTKPSENNGLGFPWQISIETGRLPSEIPDVKDDLYTHYNYDFISKHQGEEISAHEEHTEEFKKAVVDVINDDTKTGHDLEQLRIFYKQAYDLDTIKSLGMSPLQPYLDMIDKADSIKEFNKLLESDDFPFTPFICAEIGLLDTKSDTIVAITPKLLLFFFSLEGGAYYNDHDDPDIKLMFNKRVELEAAGLIPDFIQTGMESDEAYDLVTALADFETLYGKDVGYAGKYLKWDFGEYSKYISDTMISEKELYALAPSMPIEGLLKKDGKDGAEEYITGGYEWLVTLNSLWTEENLETLKLMTKAMLFDETRTYRDPTEYNKILDIYGIPRLDSEQFAYNACLTMRLLCNEMADIYVNEHLGSNAVNRLTGLTEDIINSYKNLIAETSWLDDYSRKAMTEKLDNMQLNILEPADGYLDISGLELTPTEEGGTLFGNYMKIKQYRLAQEKKLLGTPAIRSYNWYSIPPSLDNAYYDELSNSINILPGFVTSLEYRDDIDENSLLGSMGMVIAHEISHAFDYSGAQFDANGQAKPLFKTEILNEYLNRTSKLADYFSTIEVEKDKNIDGQNVVAEAAADLSGIQAVLDIAMENKDADLEKFFSSLAYEWANVLPEGEASMYAKDSHALSILRINVSLQMLKGLYEFYDIKEGNGMYLAPEKRIVLWGEDAS